MITDDTDAEMMQAYMREMRVYVDDFIRSFLFASIPTETLITRAAKSSIFAGGKRLRPILCLTAADSLDGPRQQILPWCLALELVHTYTLVHDDLPALDNDDTRRGFPTCHVTYGEPMAILAGLGLLAAAFSSPVSLAAKYQTPSLIRRLFSLLSTASGGRGVLAGQVADLLAESHDIPQEEMLFIHHHKTALLISAALQIGALVAGGREDDIERLRKFGELFGLAFQIQDDILDVIGDEEKLGKPVGSDIRSHKATFITLLGLERAQMFLHTVAERARQHLIDFSGDPTKLLWLLDYVINRDH